MKNNRHIAALCVMNSLLLGRFVFTAINQGAKPDLPAPLLLALSLLTTFIYVGLYGFALFMLITIPWEKQE